MNVAESAGRDVPILAPLAADLWELQAGTSVPPDALVCPSRATPPINPHHWRRWTFGPACEAVGVGWGTPYSGRHSFISWHIRAGVDPVTVAAWADNSPAIIWKSYAREFERSRSAERLSVADALLAARGVPMVCPQGDVIDSATRRWNDKSPA